MSRSPTHSPGYEPRLTEPFCVRVSTPRYVYAVCTRLPSLDLSCSWTLLLLDSVVSGQSYSARFEVKIILKKCVSLITVISLLRMRISLVLLPTPHRLTDKIGSGNLVYASDLKVYRTLFWFWDVKDFWTIRELFFHQICVLNVLRGQGEGWNPFTGKLKSQVGLISFIIFNSLHYSHYFSYTYIGKLESDKKSHNSSCTWLVVGTRDVLKDNIEPSANLRMYVLFFTSTHCTNDCTSK